MSQTPPTRSFDNLLEGPPGSMTSPLRQQLGVLARSRNLVAGSVVIFLSGATAYNDGARPLHSAVSVVSLDETGGSALKVRAALDHLSRRFSANGRAGLAKVTEGTPIRTCIARTWVPGLSLLPEGRSRPSPAEIPSRESLTGAIGEVRGEYDWILLDAPPVLAVADAAILCRLANSVLLVIGANSTPVGAIRAAPDQLNAVSTRRYADYSAGSRRSGVDRAVPRTR